MRKKIGYFVIILVLVLMVSGCNYKYHDITKGIRHAGFGIGASEFKCEMFLPDKEGNVASRIWYIDSSRIISDTGVVYDYLLGGEFSTGQICKQADFTRKVTAILDDKIVRADDNKLYYFTSSGDMAAYTRVLEDDNSYQIYEILFSDANVTKIVTVDASAGIYYLLKRDGNVYKYVISRANYNESPKLKSSEIVYSQGSYGGAILDFSYSLSSVATNYIRTGSSLHRNVASNQEQCVKYADIQCQYQMIDDRELFQYMDNIVAYNGGIIITTYGMVFSLLK